jgi:hypothetical protein
MMVDHKDILSTWRRLLQESRLPTAGFKCAGSPCFKCRAVNILMFLPQLRDRSRQLLLIVDTWLSG